MKTLSINITEKEFDQFGFPSEKMSFEEMIKLIKKKMVREALEKTRTAAEEAGIDDMTMEEINEEIRAVRNAKTRN